MFSSPRNTRRGRVLGDLEGQEVRGDASVFSLDDEGLRNAIVGQHKVTFRRPLTTTVADSSAWWFVHSFVGGIKSPP